MPSSNLRGVLLLATAVALFSLMDAGLKQLAADHGSYQVAALRGLASLPFVLVWVMTTTGLSALWRVRWPLHLLRGGLAVVMMVAFVHALRHLPLTSAYAIFFVAPLLITALAVPILGERVGPRRWAAILAGLAGTLVILRPGGQGMVSAAGLACLLAAFCYALSAVLVRVLARTDSTQAMVFWMLVAIAAGAGALALADWRPITPAQLWLVAGVGLSGALAQYCLTEAFRHGEASVIAPFEYTALIWGTLLDALVWGVLPERGTWLGAGIIVVAGLYLLRRERQRGSQPAVAAAGGDPVTRGRSDR